MKLDYYHGYTDAIADVDKILGEFGFANHYDLISAMQKLLELMKANNQKMFNQLKEEKVEDKK